MLPFRVPVLITKDQDEGLYRRQAQTPEAKKARGRESQKPEGESAELTAVFVDCCGGLLLFRAAHNSR